MAKLIDCRIILSNNASISEKRAASFVRQNVKLVCGKTIPIVSDDEEPAENEIVIGKTNREIMDSLELKRSRDGVWEYIIKKKNGRLYMTGLGIPSAENEHYSAYRHIDDGGVGTVLAAYRFVEDILGFPFVYSPYELYPENPELEMPDTYEYCFTCEAFRKQRPKVIDGASIYFLQSSEELMWNSLSVIIKTQNGKLIVIDGGHEKETERFLAVLETLCNGKKPCVSAWLFTHLHSDHFGVYKKICETTEYRNRIKIEKVYCNLMSEEFYTVYTPEKDPVSKRGRDVILDSDKTLGVELITVNTGDVIEIDDIRFDVIHAPLKEDWALMNLNDSSVVYKMTHTESGQTFMFLGDAEAVCDKHLVNESAEKLKSDIVQVGHHGCGNVSKHCYELIDAKVYIWPVGERFWYGETGEGYNTHNVGVERYRLYMKEFGIKKENIYVNMDKIISLPLPLPIY